ncbi:MAG: class I SAM-dependent methyltransferase [Flavobacteriales bacterium]
MGSQHANCILCGTTAIRALPGYQIVQLSKCSQCGFVFAANKPSDGELEAYYRNYGISHYLSPVTVKRYNEWLDDFENYRQTGNILDVGCGSGYFLDEAKKRGWKVFGTEYSDALVGIATDKGITMQQGGLTDETFRDFQFDVVLSIEVIEHIYNPTEEVRHIHRLLRKGGLFFCTTPNFNAISRFWLKDRYNIIAWPEHLGYFTRKTLKYLLRSQNFITLKTTTTGFSFTRMRVSLRKSEQKVVSAESDDEILRQRAESSFFLMAAKNILNFLMNITGTGVSLKGWFIKK